MWQGCNCPDYILCLFLNEEFLQYFLEFKSEFEAGSHLGLSDPHKLLPFEQCDVRDIEVGICGKNILLTSADIGVNRNEPVPTKDIRTIHAPVQEFFRRFSDYCIISSLAILDFSSDEVEHIWKRYP